MQQNMIQFRNPNCTTFSLAWDSCISVLGHGVWTRW